MAGYPLEGLRVLELGRVLAGPWAGQLLADLGADVVKVERPGVGDETRGWGPPFLEDKAAYFCAANRGKRSIAIDLAAPAGAALARQLACKADVVIENFKAGALARYGLDETSLRSLAPGLIYCSITGFGQSGPDSERPGYDFVIQAMSGLMSITGDASGAPQKVGVAVSDLMTGLYAVNAILAALRQRDATGLGQHIDMALFDCQLAGLANQAANYLASGQAPTRLGNAHPNIVPYQTFATADGTIVVAAGNDAQFRRLAHALELPELVDDARFASNASRLAHRRALSAHLQRRFQQAPTAHWTATLRASGVPAGPVNDVAAAFAEPQAAHRQMLQTLAGPSGQSVPTVRCPIRYADSPTGSNRPPPSLGEHTQEVLADWLGTEP